MLDKYKKIRLKSTNINGYLTDDNSQTSISLTKQLTLPKFKALLQKDYGGDGDCTLTSITACIWYELPEVDVQKIYDEVEKTAKIFFYNSKLGTMPIFVKNIYDIVRKKFGLSSNTTAKYIKGVGFKYEDIVNVLDTGKPVIINIFRDGRNYYNDHTITIIGYAEYDVKGTKRHLLKVYDNWATIISYVDYDLLCLLTCINF